MKFCIAGIRNKYTRRLFIICFIPFAFAILLACAFGDATVEAFSVFFVKVDEYFSGLHEGIGRSWNGVDT